MRRAVALFSCDASEKTNVQSQLVKLFPSTNCPICSWRELWSKKTCETVKQSTQKSPEVTGVENGNMFKLQRVWWKETKKKNIMCLQKKNATFEWNRGKSVYTQHDADHRPAPKEEHLASDCGKTCVLWLGWLTKKLIKNYTPFFFSPSILLLIIYSSSKYTCNVEKGTLFEITDLLNPFFATI